MTPTTTDLQKLLAEAKPAPWTFSKRNAYGANGWSVTTPLLVPGGYFSVRIPNPFANESDARLIAMAPDLAARVLELEAENKRLRDLLTKAEDKQCASCRHCDSFGFRAGLEDKP